MKSLSAVVGAAVGSAVAVIALIGPTGYFVVDSAYAGSRWDGFFDGSTAVTAAAVLVALVVAVSLRRLVIALSAAAVGLIALAVLAVSVTTGDRVGFPTAIAAGLVLGALSVATHPGTSGGDRAGRIGLAAGVVGGFLLARSLPSAGGFRSGQNRRYADYLPSPHVSVDSGTGLLTVVGAVVALIALAVFAFQIRGTAPAVTGRPAARVTTTCIGIPVAIVLLSAWSHASRSSFGETTPPGWVFGSLMIVIMLAAALVLPGRTGLAWVGVVTLVVTGAAADVSDIEWIGIVVIAVVIGLGAAASRWRHLLPIGIAVLVVIALLQLLDGESTELVALAAAVFVAPFVVSYTVAVCVSEPPSSPEFAHPAIIATALTACVPISTLRGGADFGWTAYTPLSDARSSHLDFGFGSTTGSTVTMSVVSLIAAGVVAWVIMRRSDERAPEGQ